MEDVQEMKLIKDEGFQIGMPIEEGNKVLIQVSKEEQCIYILGRRIDGFESLEEFLKYLNRFMELEEENQLNKRKLEAVDDYIKNHRKMLSQVCYSELDFLINRWQGDMKGV